MSLIFPYKSYAEAGDFYESLQGIQDNYESNEGFGKYVSNKSHLQNLKKMSSFNDFPVVLGCEEGCPKSFSSTSFQECDTGQQKLCLNKGQPFAYTLEDHSTKASFSSFISVNSQASMQSTQNCSNVAHKCGNSGKNKSKNKKKSSEVGYKQKYKTEACKYWTEKGYCDFGDQCAFAHGNQEMRQKSHISSNYKTKKCHQFHETGYCPYGVRCQFIHSLKRDCQPNRSLENLTYGEELENVEIWFTHDIDCMCMKQKARKRLPSFKLYSTEDMSSLEENKDTKIDPSESDKENIFETLFSS